MSVGSGVLKAKFEVLLVEDNPGDVQIVEYIAENHQDVHINVVENTVHSLQFLQRRERFSRAPTPDLILLDLNLPIFSGKALLIERQRHEEWKSIPVVVFTSSQADRDECLRLGANEYVTKPSYWEDWHRTLGMVFARYLR
jgi:two-component system response regulator